MKSNYEEALAAVLKHEGGFSNHPKDPGGATMRGVTQAVYDDYRTNHSAVKQSVAKIEERELQAIYRQQYWDKVWGDLLPSGVDYAVFDFAVNSGVKRAAEYLQRVAGVTPDGQIGNVTLAAVKAKDAEMVVNKLCDNRLAFLKRLSTWGTFGKGWENRVVGVRALALSLATASPRPAPAKPPEKPVEPAPVPEPLPEQKASGGLLAFILKLLAALFGRKP